MSSNNILELNALAYATFQNIIPVSEMASFGLSTVTSQAPDQTNVVGFLDGFLDNTQLKRACCVYGGAPGNAQSESYNILVRIPIPGNPATYNFNTSTFGPQWQKFQYIDKAVTIPASVCASLTDENGPYQSGTSNCDNFMNIYCSNAKADYTNAVSILGTPFDNDEFASFKPECPCYGNKPSYITGNPSPQCYFNSCSPTSGVYLSPAARQPCSATFCTANIDLSGNKVGGEVNVSSKVVQNCGNVGGENPPGSPPPPPPPKSPPASPPSGGTGGSLWNNLFPGSENGNNSSIGIIVVCVIVIIVIILIFVLKK